MGERSRARSRSGFRRSRRLRRDRRGVVAVVGTLLALLVFFALFGIFLTEYVPLWMEENESQLSNQIQGSLATLKSGIDDQYVLGGIPTYSVPFTLASQTVPLLAQPTVATLSYINGCPDGFYSTNGTPVNIGACDFLRLVYSTVAGATGSQTNNYNQTSTTNYLEVQLPNRYFTPVNYYLENDAVAGTQLNGRAWLVAPPALNISKTTTNLTVQTNFVVLLGNASSFTSQGSKDVTSHIGGVTNITSYKRFLTAAGAPRSFNVTVTLGVHDLCAWYNFLYNETEHAFSSTSSTLWTLTWSGVGARTPQTSAPTLSVCALGVSATYDLKLTILNVNYAVAPIAEAVLSFNAGGL